MHGALRACAAATNLVQWSLRATSTGSILIPGCAVSNSAIVFLQIGSYWLSVRFAVCHCSTICGSARAVPDAAAATIAASTRRTPSLVLMRLLLVVQRAGALRARLRAIAHVLER